MMYLGVSGSGLPVGLKYGDQIEKAAEELGFPPCWLYAHGWQETIKVSGWMETMGKTPADYISGDGGHGIFQLTSSFPDNWTDPQANAEYAIKNFLIPAATYWNKTYGYTGDTLVKCVAAEFNAGRGGAESGHREGDVGKFTTHTDGVSYSDLVLKYFGQLASGLKPSD